MRLTNLLRSTASAAVVGAVAFGFAGAAQAQDGQTATTVDDILSLIHISSPRDCS